MNKVTVVIPNYNGIAFMENCYNSLKEQKYQEFDILVVDNGSTDGSLEYLRSLTDITLIEFSENRGFCLAVNEGIIKSVTEYVLLLNNDTTVDPDFVEEMLRSISNNTKIFSSSAKMLDMKNPEIIDGAGDLYCALGWAFARGKGKNAAKYHTDCQIFSACGGAVIYRKSVFDEIGLFDESHFAYLEDVDLGYRALIHGYKNVFAHKAIVFHAGSAVSGSRYNEFKIKLSSKNSIYLIYKNMPFLQILFNLPLLIIGFLFKFLFFTKKGFGGIYLGGLWKGICSCFSKKARNKRVTFEFKNFLNYLKIQFFLIVNIFRKFA